ncbi:MAG: 4-hydroxy-tetrahydrodipicolinate reductase [Acidimicrobiia bacterium]
MIRVAVSGAGGRMGRLVADSVATADDLDLAACFDPRCAGEAVAGVAVTADPEEFAAADVVVEFTVPAVVRENLRRWRALGLHAVVGTSGEGPPNCLVAPNFSIGAVVMMRLAELAAPHFAAAEVIELHHDAKADAPSGTALATAERIAAASDQVRKADSVESVAGARGGAVSGVPVHAVRLPGLVAHQEVLLGGPGETLTVRHDTTDRTAFMPGVLLAVRSISQLEDPVTVGIEGLLGL